MERMAAIAAGLERSLHWRMVWCPAPKLRRFEASQFGEAEPVRRHPVGAGQRLAITISGLTLTILGCSA